jgi:Phasin protein
MQAQETGLKTVIKNASTLVQEAASKSEAAALAAVERVEGTLADVQSKWSDAREIGSRLVDTIGHAGRTSFDGVAEFNGALGRYGKEALTDTIELGRKTIKAQCLKELVELHVDYVTRRNQAMFASVSELNAIAQSKTIAAWSPLGETVRKIVERPTAKAAA